ncbi:fumarylacetoacetate hydrolase family protein [Marinivivus vitaminiproducens]|uniref:fumarylacetoacetate hydrolase family protein n=1 Tax=Marinivivus vitaminiproducens TaxID=3035935 RepID=UPI0027A36792|nr:fumarylacetoacetate hydrolase family protein [Geminicoccaceae bacterium SCSIO 64248]
MRLVTYTSGSGDAVGLVQGETVHDVAKLVADAPADMIGLVAAGPAVLDRLREAASGAGEGQPLGGVTLRRPIARPGKTICLGLNYVDHAKEGGNEVPEYPALFLRVNSSLVDPGAPVIRPRVSEKFDYEVELMAVIGKGGHDIAEADALGHVFGYTVFNDGSVRDFQRKTTQWTPGKNFDGSGPMGPWIVTADELPQGAHGLAIQSRLNGQVMQDSNTEHMMFPVARTIAIVSQVMTLEPGDVIAMGTPAGVGFARKPPVFMKAGDVIECEIEKIGVLSNPVIDA